MRCGYIILTFVLGLAVASPAMWLVYALCNIPRPLDHPLGGLVCVGGLQIIAVFVVAFAKIAERAIPKAKPELDALRAGLRGEDAP